MADHRCGEFAFGDNRDLHLTAAERARGLKLERAFRAALSDVAGKVMARYRANAREALSASVTGITPGGLYDDTWWLDAVEEHVAQPYREVIYDVARAAIVTAAGNKVAKSFDVHNPWIDEVAAERLDAIDGWSTTQKNWVTDQVMKGLKNGWGVDDLAAKLSAGPLDDGANAQRIAQNQLIGASNGASVAAWRSYGFDGATKAWASAGDGRVRETHQEADGQEVALDESFEVGGETGMYPGDASLGDEAENCRCTVLFIGAGDLTETDYENLADSGGAASVDQPDGSAFDGAPIDAGGGLDSYVADDNGDSFAASAAGAAKEAPVAEATLVADNAAEPDLSETPSTATWEFGGYRVLHPGQSCDNRYEVVDKDGNSQGCHKYLRDAKKQIKHLEEKDQEASVARAEQARSEEPHADAMTAAVDPEELAVDPANPAGAPVDDTLSPGEGEAGPVQPWSGVLVQEGVDTGDNRRIAPGALVWEALPHPLMVMLENPEGGGGHDGAELGGRIDGYARDGGAVVGVGVFDLGGEAGCEAVRMMRLGMIRGVSVDLDDIEYEFDGGDEIDYMMGNATIVFTRARIRGATVTPFPAFIGAEIELVDDVTDDVALVAASGEGGYRFPTRAVAHTQIEGWGMPEATIVASAVGDIVDSPALRLPPVSAFARKDHKEFQPFSIDSEGFGSGHIVAWGDCHIGYPGQCVPLPKSDCGYRWARTGHVLCEGNELVPTARVYFKSQPGGGSHAPKDMTAEQAAEWYENTCSVGMDVALYDDKFGLQMVGRVRPGISKLQEIALRASDFSPDWRTWPRQFKLQAIAVAAVNVSGNPSRYERLPALAASAVEAGMTVDPIKLTRPGAVIEGHVTGGELVTLVASPVGQSKRASAVSLLADQVAGLQAQVEDLKAALLPIRRERALAALDAGPKPIRAREEVA